MSEERGFEVIDKRRVSAEESATPEGEGGKPEATDESAVEGAEGREPAAGPASPEAPADATAEGAEEPSDFGAAGSLPEMDATGVVALCVNMLHEVAWIKLGLVPSPMTQKIERDLPQARLAIDCAADLVRHLDPHLDAAARRDLQNLISMLRMNYVQQSQR